MDSLPVELLRLIFEQGDAKTARTVRLVSRRLADVGYDYMLSDQFTILRRTNDVDRLHSIALHDRLCGSIRAVTFNFSEREFVISSVP
jgi:hypothetical protein